MPRQFAHSAHRHQSAAALDALGIEMGVLLADAGRGQRADKAACGAADHGSAHRANRCRQQPAAGHDRPDAGNGEKPEPRQQSTRAAQHRADAGACAGIVGQLVLVVDDAVQPVGHQRDIGVVDAGVAQRTHCRCRFFLRIEKSGYHCHFRVLRSCQCNG